jgi:hypothetical protein
MYSKRMNNPTILINVSKKKLDRYLISHNNVDYYIISDNIRTKLSNMFDALGNISNYNDYYSFLSKHPQFKAICKCSVSNSIKEPLLTGHGLLVGIDNKTRELLFPIKETVDWILHKHEYKIYNPIVFVKADESYISPFNEVKELEIIPAKVESENTQEHVKENEDAIVKTEEPVPQSYSKTFWSYLGWS